MSNNWDSGERTFDLGREGRTRHNSLTILQSYIYKLGLNNMKSIFLAKNN